MIFLSYSTAFFDDYSEVLINTDTQKLEYIKAFSREKENQIAYEIQICLTDARVSEIHTDKEFGQKRIATILSAYDVPDAVELSEAIKFYRDENEN